MNSQATAPDFFPEIDANSAPHVPEQYANVPQFLKDLPNWVVWKYETRDGEPTKVPYDVSTGRRAEADNPNTWSTFEQAVEAADVLNGKDYEGIGFELMGTDFAGCDFDGVLRDGVAEPFTLDILKLLSNSYCEITPSEHGLRTIVRCAALPVGKRKFSKNKYGPEIYSGSEGGRFLTITGKHFSGRASPK